MPKPVQEAFGEAIIESVRQFALQDMDDVATLESSYLSHVGDPAFRRTLAETLFGARWIYKLGLALLVKDEEQMAHVRAQLIDYCSVCEGVLSDMILHGIGSGHMTGVKYQYSDLHYNRYPISWSTPPTHQEIAERNFYWLIVVAKEEGIIDDTLAEELHWLRKERNAVHLRARTYSAYLGKSKRAFAHLGELFRQSKSWKATHP